MEIYDFEPYESSPYAIDYVEVRFTAVVNDAAVITNSFEIYTYKDNSFRKKVDSSIVDT